MLVTRNKTKILLRLQHVFFKQLHHFLIATLKTTESTRSSAVLMGEDYSVPSRYQNELAHSMKTPVKAFLHLISFYVQLKENQSKQPIKLKNCKVWLTHCLSSYSLDSLGWDEVKRGLFNGIGSSLSWMLLFIRRLSREVYFIGFELFFFLSNAHRNPFD